MDNNTEASTTQNWRDLYNRVQLMAVGARASGNFDRERAALDILHVMDGLERG